MLEVLPLASGSQGNSTLIRSSTTALLIDAGLTRKEMLLRLAHVEQDPGDLAGILLTHRHKDHCRAAATLCRRFKIPLYGTARTVEHQQPRTLPQIREINPGESFDVGDLQIRAHTLSHDAPDTQSFVFESNEGQRIGIATDLGCSQGGVADFLQALDVLLLEFNHDAALLQAGPYPTFLKQRIASDLGHLSNEQAAELLARVMGPRLQTLYLCHLSQHNNDAFLAQEMAEAVTSGLAEQDPRILIARQDRVTEGTSLR